GLAVVLIVGEEEQLVLDDRATDRSADVVVFECARIERIRSCLGADGRVVAPVVEERATKLVRAALRHHVDPSSDEVALPDIVRRAVDLYLLERIRWVGGDFGRVARLATKPEGFVEFRAV